MRARGLVALVVALAAGLAPAGRNAAHAQSFPNHPIKIIVGPSPDVFSRIIAEHLQQAWGQPVVVEPRPGAGGKLAVTAVSSAAPDGHTLLFATPTYTLNTAMKVASYDLREFVPVANIGLISYALVTRRLPGIHRRRHRALDAIRRSGRCREVEGPAAMNRNMAASGRGSSNDQHKPARE